VLEKVEYLQSGSTTRHSLSNKDKNKHKGSHKFQSKVGKQDVRKTPWTKAEKDAVFRRTKLRKV